MPEGVNIGIRRGMSDISPACDPAVFFGKRVAAYTRI